MSTGSPTSANAPAFLSRFRCLGAECEDTCCQGWSMQLDDATWQAYQAKAPELCDSVVEEEGAGRVMRRDAKSGFCTKLENGLCGIQAKYGAAMLGDACSFYPRIARKLGDQLVMTGAMSCPEIARLALLSDESLLPDAAFVPERLPHEVKDYLPQGITAADALAVHRAFLAATQDDAATAERVLARIASVARSFDMMDVNVWAQAAPLYFQLADSRLPAPTPSKEDPFNLLHTLCGLVVASRKSPSPRLAQLIARIEAQLGCTLDWKAVQITLSPDSQERYRQLVARWQQMHAHLFAPYIKRWIAAQMLTSLFPFTGPNTLSERATLLGLRFAMLKLALLTSVDIMPDKPAQEVLVMTVQTLARFLDHLGDPSFTLAICQETGWSREDRMRGLLEGTE